METVKIADISVGSYHSNQHIIDEMYKQLDKQGSSIAIAINPEKVLATIDSDEIKKVIQQCDIKYADGVGVVKAMENKLGKKLPRLPGCELWVDLMKSSVERHTPVYLVGASEEVLSLTRKKLQQEFGCDVVGSSNGFFTDEDSVIESIKASEAKIVTVAMGSPKQEQFIFKCKKRGVEAIFMGVGGTYNVFVGHVKRAPYWFVKLNLEWFYRLCSEPTRYKRQLNLLRYLHLYLRKKI